MNEMDPRKKEELTIATGFVMILLVLVFTLLRNDIFKKDETNSSKSSPTSTQSKTSSQKYTTVSTSDLQKKILTEKDKLVLLDVRPFDGYIEEHIVDAINIPLDEFPVASKIDAHKQIILIGQQANDNNVSAAVDKLKDEDFNNILVLAGGMDSWKQMSGPTVSYGDPKSFVDQSKVSYLDPEELNEALKASAPVYILDVRSNDDFKKGHIQGAVNIPLEELEKRRNEISERKAVVVGANELDEFQASVQIFDMLLVSPFVMRTAMPGWQSKGFPLVAS